MRLHARCQRRGPISWLINRSSSFRGRRQSSPGWPEGSQSARPTRATAGGAPAALFLFGLGTWHGGGRIICATTPSPFWRRVRAPLAGGTVPPRSAGAYAARATPGSSARHADGGSRPQSYLPMQPHPVPSRRRSHICCAHGAYSPRMAVPGSPLARRRRTGCVAWLLQFERSCARSLVQNRLRFWGPELRHGP